MAHYPNPYTNYHLFLSYARRDNESPVNAEGEGWVTAFARELKRRHRRYSGRVGSLWLGMVALIGNSLQTTD